MPIIPLTRSMVAVRKAHHTAVFIAIIIRFSSVPVREGYWLIIVNPNKPPFLFDVITTNPNANFSVQYKTCFTCTVHRLITISIDLTIINSNYAYIKNLFLKSVSSR